MTDTKRYQAIEETLYNIDSETLCELWNKYCEVYGPSEDKVYPMYTLNDFYLGKTVAQFLSDLGDHFDASDEYIKFETWGLCSYCDITDAMEIEDLADYIEENPDDFRGLDPDLDEALDTEEDEDEDEDF